MLQYAYDEETMRKEFDRIKNSPGDFKKSPKMNKIVLTFQPSYYYRENKLWEKPEIREKLINNRLKYLFKENESQLNDKELLRGFKISGIFIGYTHFSPLWVKGFIEKYNIHSIYDPCGGWGHRLLGAYNIKYIYNDSNPESFTGVKNISNFCQLKDKYFYNNDASEFTPLEFYDSVFTCPPYFNTEWYPGENSSINKYPLYEEWLNSWWRKVIQKSVSPNVKIFAFAINNKFKEDMSNICIQEGLQLLEDTPLGINSLNHFQRTSKYSRKGESLLIYKKG
jgi:hypothetical protein